MSMPITSSLRLVAVALTVVVSLEAQCDLQIRRGNLSGPDASVFATAMHDPDGPGPLLPQLLVGGNFTRVASRRAALVASYDLGTNTWAPLGSLSGGTVRCLASTSSGLVVGGLLFTAGSVAVNNVALWTSSGWQPMGTGLPGRVDALTVLPNGDLLAGGTFTEVGGVGPGHLARWNGTQWTLFGGGADNNVEALLTTPSGLTIVGGQFTSVGLQPASSIAIWNGAAWQAFPSEPTGVTHAVALAANGDIVIGGDYASGPGLVACKLARWNGSAWSPLTIALDGAVRALANAPNGDLLFGGDFTSNGPTPFAHIGRWNGANLLPIADGLDASASSITVLPNGDIAASSAISNTGGVSYLRRFNGTSWSSLPPGSNGTFFATGNLPNGDLVVAGVFTEIEGLRAANVARYDGAQWHTMGTGALPARALLIMQNGTLVIGGSAMQSLAPGSTTWTTLPNTGLATIFDLVESRAGEIVAAGSGSPPIVVLRNGTWQALGNSGPTSLLALDALRRQNGDLLFQGALFQNGISTPLSVFDGTSWSALPAPPANIVRISETRSGALLACGFPLVSRFDGVNWTTIPGSSSGPAHNLVELDNGDLVVAGYITSINGQPTSGLVRWDGSAWSTVGDLVGDIGLVGRAHGALVVSAASSSLSNQWDNVAVLTTPCPATATARGNGCNGSAGPIALRADVTPWIGGECRATATGLAPNALALAIVGTQSLQQPLSLAHPAAGAACVQLASADVLVAFATATAGSATFAIAVPRVASLVGLTFHEQAVQIEAGATGNITALSSTNALVLTIGVL